jgi:hypothetical protein
MYRQSSFHGPKVNRSLKLKEVPSTPVSTPVQGKWSVSRSSCYSSEGGVAGAHYRDSPTLWNNYITEEGAQVQFCACQNAVYTHIRSTTYAYTKQSDWHPNTNTPESDRPQHERPAAYVIAHQYSSASSVSLRFYSPMGKKTRRALKKCHFKFSLFLKKNH